NIALTSPANRSSVGIVLHPLANALNGHFFPRYQVTLDQQARDRYKGMTIRAIVTDPQQGTVLETDTRGATQPYSATEVDGWHQPGVSKPGRSTQGSTVRPFGSAALSDHLIHGHPQTARTDGSANRPYEPCCRRNEDEAARVGRGGEKSAGADQSIANASTESRAGWA